MMKKSFLLLSLFALFLLFGCAYDESELGLDSLNQLGFEKLKIQPATCGNNICETGESKLNCKDCQQSEQALDDSKPIDDWGSKTHGLVTLNAYSDSTADASLSGVLFEVRQNEKLVSYTNLTPTSSSDPNEVSFLLPIGEYTITALKAGFFPQKTTVSVSAFDALNENFYLYVDTYDPKKPTTIVAPNAQVSAVWPGAVTKIVNNEPLSFTVYGTNFSPQSLIKIDGILLTSFPGATLEVVNNEKMKVIIPQSDRLRLTFKTLDLVWDETGKGWRKVNADETLSAPNTSLGKTVNHSISVYTPGVNPLVTTFTGDKSRANFTLTEGEACETLLKNANVWLPDSKVKYDCEGNAYYPNETRKYVTSATKEGVRVCFLGGVSEKKVTKGCYNRSNNGLEVVQKAYNKETRETHGEKVWDLLSLTKAAACTVVPFTNDAAVLAAIYAGVSDVVQPGPQGNLHKVGVFCFGKRYKREFVETRQIEFSECNEQGYKSYESEGKQGTENTYEISVNAGAITGVASTVIKHESKAWKKLKDKKMTVEDKPICKTTHFDQYEKDFTEINGVKKDVLKKTTLRITHEPKCAMASKTTSTVYEKNPRRNETCSVTNTFWHSDDPSKSCSTGTIGIKETVNNPAGCSTQEAESMY